MAEQARTSIDSQLKTARELNQQLEARLLEAEKEKLELQEEKMKAVECVEERVRNAHGWHVIVFVTVLYRKITKIETPPFGCTTGEGTEKEHD